MPWRLWRRSRGRERRFAVLTAAAMVLLAGVIWALVVGFNSNQSEIDKRPTKAQLLAALARNRDISRRACRVSNTRFSALRAVVAVQQPSAQTTDYYATHPQELHRARVQFNQILRVLAPRNCIRLFPVPTTADVTGGDTPPGHGQPP